MTARAAGVAGEISLGQLGRGVIRARRVLVASGLAGAALALAYVALVPAVYRSGTDIRIDPRPLQISKQDARSKLVYRNRDAIALLESQVRIFKSTALLSAVIGDLGLDRDREFGTVDASGPERAWELLTGLAEATSAGRPGRPPPAACSTGAPDTGDCQKLARRTALEALRRAITIRRVPGSYVIRVQVSSEVPDKAARIADGIAAAYIREIRRSDAERLREASQQTASGVPALEETVASDGNEIDRVRRQIRAVSGSRGLVDEQQLTEVTRLLAEARAWVRTLQLRSDGLSRLARSGAGLDREEFPEFPALEALRLRQASLAAEEGGLATKLGLRHPDAVGLARQRERIRALLRQELARTAEAVRNDYARARAEEGMLSSRAAELGRRSLATSAALVELRKLERVEAADGAALQAAHRRAAELAHGSAVGLENVRVLGLAETPRGPTMSRPIFVALAALSGVTMAAVWVAIRSQPDEAPTDGTAV